MGEDTKELEKVVGLQTDKPLKRAFMPFGGIKMAEQACETYGYKPNPKFHRFLPNTIRPITRGVYDAYTPEMRLARKNKIITACQIHTAAPYRRRLSTRSSLRIDFLSLRKRKICPIAAAAP